MKPETLVFECEVPSLESWANVDGMAPIDHEINMECEDQTSASPLEVKGCPLTTPCGSRWFSMILGHGQIE